MKRTLPCLLLAASILLETAPWPLPRERAWAWAQEAGESPGAQELPSLALAGRIFSDLYVPFASTSVNALDRQSYRQASTSFWLQGDPKLGEHSSARFVLAADAIEASRGSAGLAGSAVGDDSKFRARAREAYVAYFKDGWEARLGRQILPWGKTDALNPTDFLSAKDYAFFNPDEEVRRIGATSLWTTWTPAQGNSPLAFTAVVTPVFPQSRLLIPTSAVPAGVELAANPIQPPTTVANTELALKGAYNGSNWDASLLAFRGFNHLPEFVLVGQPASPSAPIAIAQTFHRVHALGGDGSLTVGKWILRAESAYVWTENDDGTNPLIQPSRWDSVVGVERPLGDDFRVQVQGVYRYFPAFQEPGTAGGTNPLLAAINAQIARANALLLGYQDKSRPGATFRISYSNESSGVDAELFLVGNFVGGDYLARPKITYAWTDAIRTTAGLEYYGGPDDRPLGALKSFNSLFIEAKYSF